MTGCQQHSLLICDSESNTDEWESGWPKLPRKGQQILVTDLEWIILEDDWFSMVRIDIIKGFVYKSQVPQSQPPIPGPWMNERTTLSELWVRQLY